LDFDFRGKHDPDSYSPWFNFNETYAKYVTE